MTAIVLRGDARRLPLPDACVDLIVTSPPYFGLRSYTDTCRVCLDIRATGFDPAETIKGYDEHVRMRHHYDGQIGSEATPQEWVAALVECTREWARVLKPSGSMFVNLGDKYAGGGQGGNVGGNLNGGPHLNRTPAIARHVPAGAQAKSLLGLPWRYALAATDQLGLILRRDIIWAKPNGLPESVTDRCRSSHEYVFHLTRQPRYYAAVDEIREPHTGGAHSSGNGTSRRWAVSNGGQNHRALDTDPAEYNPLGKLPGSVWNIPSQPLTVPPALGVDHFAAFPSELPRRCVLGWSPGGVCVACGEGRRPVRGVDWSKVPHRLEEKRTLNPDAIADWCRAFADWCTANGVRCRDLDLATGTGMGDHWATRGSQPAIPTPAQWATIKAKFHPPESLDAQVYEPVYDVRIVPAGLLDAGSNVQLTGRHRTTGGGLSSSNYQTITGYACACPTPDAPTRPAIVLDPFGGTGTTALVASVYGRTGISIDHSADYNRIAAWRTQDPAERCRVIGAPKPPPVLDGQDALFDFTADGAAT